MYIPGVCFVIFLAIVGGYLLLSLKWLKEKVIPKKVYGKFETVFNHRNSPASRRIWRSRAFLPQIVPITLGRMRLELVSLTRRSRLSQRSSRKFVSFLSLFIEEAVVRHRMRSAQS
jgi:hypothetical protein